MSDNTTSPGRVERVDLLVASVRPAVDGKREVLFDGDTWMTVWDGDLPRVPRVGDVLRVRIPRAEAIVQDGPEAGRELPAWMKENRP